MAAIALNEILAWHARDKAQLPAYCLDGVALSWQELEQLSDARAAHLAALGVAHDELVALSLPNGRDFIATLFAIWKCGATPLPMSPRLPADECRAILALSNARVHVAEQECPGSSVPRLPPDFGITGAAAVARATTTYWKACTSGGSTGRERLIPTAPSSNCRATAWC
jgi:bile acid-coenzyme A ligase